MGTLLALNSRAVTSHLHLDKVTIIYLAGPPPGHRFMGRRRRSGMFPKGVSQIATLSTWHDGKHMRERDLSRAMFEL